MSEKIINLFDGKNIVKNKDGKYSSLLNEFITPFIPDFQDVKFQGDMFEFAINTWNIAIFNEILTPTQFKELIAKEPHENYDLFQRMVNSKIKNFKEYTNFIIDYEIEQKDTEIIIRVVTQLKEDFLKSMVFEMEGFDIEDEEDNFINRSAIITIPNQPFFDWINQTFPDDLIEKENVKEVNTYLIDENIEDIKDIEKWLKKNYKYIFRIELESWCFDENLWPKKLTYKLFNQFFNIQFSSMIYDFEDSPILKIF